MPNIITFLSIQGRNFEIWIFPYCFGFLCFKTMCFEFPPQGFGDCSLFFFSIGEVYKTREDLREIGGEVCGSGEGVCKVGGEIYGTWEGVWEVRREVREVLVSGKVILKFS